MHPGLEATKGFHPIHRELFAIGFSGHPSEEDHRTGIASGVIQRLNWLAIAARDDFGDAYPKGSLKYLGIGQFGVHLRHGTPAVTTDAKRE